MCAPQTNAAAWRPPGAERKISLPFTAQQT
nr:MAG TPA: hypothetical protein [Caudoviricetes sp.]